MSAKLRCNYITATKRAVASLSESAEPELHNASVVAASVGHSHDPNVMHRPTMEDTLSVAIFDDFPGLFLGLYDGHGGSLAAVLLRQQLHRHFLDELLANKDDVDVGRMGMPVGTPMPSSPPEDCSACSTPPYEPSEDSTDHEAHPLNTASLDVASAFRDAYEKMDAVLKTRRCCRTGATAVTCFVRKVRGVGRVLTTANCGDSRAVLSRGGRAMRLSVDHRPVDADERQRVEAAGGFVACQRVNGVLNVSRAFGDHSMKSMVVSTPDVGEVVLSDMDEFAVLACDGLWDFMDDATVIGVAQGCFDRGLDAREVSQVLVKEAIKRRSTDNVSVMVVQFDMDDD